MTWGHDSSWEMSGTPDARKPHTPSVLHWVRVDFSAPLDAPDCGISAATCVWGDSSVSAWMQQCDWVRFVAPVFAESGPTVKVEWGGVCLDRLTCIVDGKRYISTDMGETWEAAS